MTRRPVVLMGVLLLAVLAVLHAGCTPSPSSSPASPASGARPTAPVPLAETFVLSGLRLSHDTQKNQLLVSYVVLNRGASRVRAILCADFLDKDGYAIFGGRSLNRISLNPGDSDTVEHTKGFASSDWKETRMIRLYISDSICAFNPEHLRSAVLWVDSSGQPLPPGARTEVKTSEEAPPGPQFQLREVQVTPHGQDTVRVSYVITNLTQGRASAFTCVRLLQEPSCSCQSLDWAELDLDFELGLGASERRTDTLPLHFGDSWEKARRLLVYLSPLGCNASSDDATSNVVSLERPRLPSGPAAQEPGVLH